MDDVKRAREIADEDPEAALALLEKHPVLAPCRKFNMDETEKRLGLSSMRVDLCERLGRHEAAAAEQADATRFLEMQLDFMDRETRPDERIFGLLSQIAEDDPEGALALLEKHPVLAPCQGFRIDETEKRLELSSMRVDLCERLGRHDAAVAEQADATRYLEMRLDDLEHELNPAKSSFQYLYPFRAWYLERMGRRVDATRCYVFLADYLLASAGDAGAKAGLKAAAAAGTGGTAVSAPTASGVAEGLGSVISVLGGGGGFAFGAKAYNKAANRRDGRKWRLKVLGEGLAIQFAHCERCGYVVPADFMTCQCVAGHKVAEVRVVALGDAPPAWYYDPWRRFKFRFWNGEAWTSQVASGGTVAEDPPGGSSAQDSAA